MQNAVHAAIFLLTAAALIHSTVAYGQPDLEQRLSTLEQQIGELKRTTPNTIGPRDATFGLDAGVQLDAIAKAIPKNVVLFFNRQPCPAGFEEFKELRGRYVVGLPDAGALAARVGEPLKDREARNEVGYHNHSIKTGQFGHHHNEVDAHVVEYTFPTKPDGPLQEGRGSTQRPSQGTGGATFDKESVLTDFYGVQDRTNAPYIQLLACIRR